MAEVKNRRDRWSIELSRRAFLALAWAGRYSPDKSKIIQSWWHVF
jgi:hypothetical protein